MFNAAVNLDRSYEIPKTIWIGDSNVDELRSAFRADVFTIGDLAGQILGNIVISSEQRKIDLSWTTVSELGLRRAHKEDIYKRAHLLGKEPVPNEFAFRFRLKYRRQPQNEWLFIASDEYIFHILNDGHGLWLFAEEINPFRLYSPDDIFIFASQDYCK